MSSDWPLVSIGDIAGDWKGSMAVGPFGSRMKADLYVPSGVRVIRGNNLSGGREPEGEYVHVSEETADSLASCCLIPGDLVFPHRGNIGEVGITPDDGRRYMLSTSLMKLSPDRKKVNPLYLMYFFKSAAGRAALLMNASQVGTPGIATPLKSLRSVQFHLPPLEIQNQIAETLGKLDDRITLLREIKTTLETIAQALFKSWFVDFDPVKAKIQGHVPEGMDEATANLFPNSWEKSELGPVPKGWRVERLGDVCSYLNRGISPKYLEEGGVLVINQKCIRDFSVDYSKARRHDSAQRKIDGRQLETGDILVNSTGVGTLGRVAQVLALHEVAIVDSHVTVVRAGQKISWPYLGQWMIRQQPNIEAMGEGSTGQTELARSKLAMLPILVPSVDALNAFDAIVKSLTERIAVNESCASELTTLRNTILPRLISGQLQMQMPKQSLQEAES